MDRRDAAGDLGLDGDHLAGNRLSDAVEVDGHVLFNCRDHGYWSRWTGKPGLGLVLAPSQANSKQKGG